MSAPTTAEVEALMRRCQAGCGGARALDDAHGLLAECYGMLGALAAERERYMAALQEADTLLGHDDEETEWRERWAGLWPDVGAKLETTAAPK